MLCSGDPLCLIKTGFSPVWMIEWMNELVKKKKEVKEFLNSFIFHLWKCENKFKKSPPQVFLFLSGIKPSDKYFSSIFHKSQHIPHYNKDTTVMLHNLLTHSGCSLCEVRTEKFKLPWKNKQKCLQLTQTTGCWFTSASSLVTSKTITKENTIFLFIWFSNVVFFSPPVVKS